MKVVNLYFAPPSLYCCARCHRSHSPFLFFISPRPYKTCLYESLGLTGLSQLCSAKSEKGCITSVGVARGAEMPHKIQQPKRLPSLPHNDQRLNNPVSIYFNGYIIYTICQRRDIKYCVRDVERYLLRGQREQG